MIKSTPKRLQNYNNFCLVPLKMKKNLVLFSLGHKKCGDASASTFY